MPDTTVQQRIDASLELAIDHLTASRSALALNRRCQAYVLVTTTLELVRAAGDLMTTRVMHPRETTPTAKRRPPQGP